MSRPRAVLFDLGNTLVAYYRKEEFTPVLHRCVDALLSAMEEQGLSLPDPDAAFTAALQENREASDHRFSPLLPRLSRICRQPLTAGSPLAETLGRAFMQPIFDTARRYEDALPVLAALKAQGISTAIVSNSPWGSAADWWREELVRLALAPQVSAIVMCGDVGWRKPAPQIFLHTAQQLGVEPGECVFVGDDVHWDIEGSTAVGMRGVLIDRNNLHAGHAGERLNSLQELQARLV